MPYMVMMVRAHADVAGGLDVAKRVVDEETSIGGDAEPARGETEDARACLEWLRSRYPHLPAMVAGFSFGSRIALRIGAQRPDLRKVIAAGFPTVYKDRSYLDPCVVARTFIHSTNDEFGRHGHRDQLERG